MRTRKRDGSPKTGRREAEAEDKKEERGGREEEAARESEVRSAKSKGPPARPNYLACSLRSRLISRDTA